MKGSIFDWKNQVIGKFFELLVVYYFQKKGYNFEWSPHDEFGQVDIQVSSGKFHFLCECKITLHSDFKEQVRILRKKAEKHKKVNSDRKNSEFLEPKICVWNSINSERREILRNDYSIKIINFKEEIFNTNRIFANMSEKSRIRKILDNEFLNDL
ncbi:MAG: hypothetical protein GF311_00565 [Candidatus Lokiarchaeota archaeon]|nr:hypothetical protein [Candidatus Lokiarchaeota archaeon]